MKKSSHLLWCSLAAFALLIGLHTPKAQAIGHNGIPGTYEGCIVCHDFINGVYEPTPEQPGTGNLRWIRSSMEWPTGVIHSGITYTKASEPLPADGTLADGNDSDLDGPCEVCHTETNYHTNTGDGLAHFDGEDCTSCHPHFADDIDNFFQPVFTGTQSHATHLSADDPKGPQFEAVYPGDACTQCHNLGDYSLFSDGEPLATTGVCDPCHSPGGALDGSAEAKTKWVDAVYEENGVDLKAGNENWCATCHDGGSSIIYGAIAANVAGDNSTFGYNITGHGNYDVACEDCHDLTIAHLDGKQRTYSASSGNYQVGYRLNQDMAVPRNGESHPQAFALCTECHVYSAIVGDQSNFRDDAMGLQFHDMHLVAFPTFIAADTDYDGTIDSAPTCINCHNVHGPGPANAPPVMIRHGELISTPGTTDKVPAFDFHWYESLGGPETNLLLDSRYGTVLNSSTSDLSANGVCYGCHGGELTYYRSPFGPTGIVLDAVYTSNLDDVAKTEFYPGEDFRCHAEFTLTADEGTTYFVQIKNSGVGNTSSMPGTDWQYGLSKQGNVGPGSYDVYWQGSIPSEADPDSPAILIIKIYAYDTNTATLLDKDEKQWNFTIISAP